MPSCPSCNKEIASDAVSCPSCGSVIDPSIEPTRLLSDSLRPANKPTSDRSFQRNISAPSPRDSIDDARFVAGTVFAGRYRIVGLLGKGGMGEVYRADDLTLGQPVALKFLPEVLATDGAALSRFHREVRVSRQVSHRNVCRVHDIGEIDGQHFLSMEFIRGEELSSLMRRIGRLPPDKAIEIARQLCAGVAAAHDNGVLHRDLKPANIMIDSVGNVRITDFGLAGLAEELRSEEAVAGTPSYMSPEQIEGTELSARSDIYSLGLVLYELFTGKKAFEANSLVQLMHLRRNETTPTLPSTLVKDLDPAVERVILRCIEKDPEKRPQSALQVAAALPGGDPLAAALAAGETPSPEMVAASAKEGALSPAVAASMTAGVVVGLLVIIFLSGRVMMHRQIPLDKSAAALEERAIALTNELGYTEAPADSDHGFVYNENYLRYILLNDNSKTRWQRLANSQPATVSFWYRQSPRPLELYLDVVSVDNPPIPSGIATVVLDTRGQLRKFVIAPPQVDTSEASTMLPNWPKLIGEAGLAIDKLNPVTSTWVPPVNSDTRAAWEGQYAGPPSVPIHIESASYHGKPVYFEVIEPWTTPYRMQQSSTLVRLRILVGTAAVLAIILLAAALSLARRNLKLGRADRIGAFKLAFFLFVLDILTGVFEGHHVYSLSGEFKLIVVNLAFAILAAALLWLIYIALEPTLRRRWPHRIVSWNRLLTGNFRDPLVGKDLLIGALAGVAILLNTCLWHIFSQWLGRAPEMPVPASLESIQSLSGLATMFSAQLINSIVYSSIDMFMLLLFYIVLRKEWLAVGMFWLVLVVFQTLASANLTTGLIHSMFGAAVAAFVLVRFGFLAFIFTQFFILFAVLYPLTSNVSAWYATPTFFAFALGASLAIYGCYISLAGQPLFKGGLLKDT